MSSAQVFAKTPSVSPADALQKMKSGQAVIVDVREKDEIDKGKITGSLWLPMSDVDDKPKALEKFLAKIPKEKEVILYCGSGRRAGMVGEKVTAQGRKVSNLGGYADWKAAGLPVTQP